MFDCNKKSNNLSRWRLAVGDASMPCARPIAMRTGGSCKFVVHKSKAPGKGDGDYLDRDGMAGSKRAKCEFVAHWAKCRRTWQQWAGTRPAPTMSHLWRRERLLKALHCAVGLWSIVAKLIKTICPQNSVLSCTFDCNEDSNNLSCKCDGPDLLDDTLIEPMFY